MIIGMAATAYASEPMEAKRSGAVFRVNGIRMPFRAYTINEDIYLNLFEVAVALSGSEKQFYARWRERNAEILIISGRPYTDISVNLARKIAEAGAAIPKDIRIIHGSEEIDITVFYVEGEHYFKLQDMARALDFGVDRNQTDSTVDIDTSIEFVENTTTGISRMIDPSKPMVAITYDDGPSRFTTQILDVLEQHEAVATFFVIGSRVEDNADIIRRALAMGCEIGNHGWSHRSLTRMSETRLLTELLDTNSAIEAITEFPTLLMRPPYGAVNRRLRSVTADIELPIIYWSIDPKDWMTKSSSETHQHIMTNVRDRDIILMHDIYAATVQASRRVIPALINRGYQLVTVSELMYYSEITPEPGVVYFSGRRR
jgi:peptidoglycan/xylan/chitin deacetylase (PgdA/CDA1 family)